VHFTLFWHFLECHTQASSEILFNSVIKCLHFEAKVTVNEGVPECTLHFFGSQTFTIKLLIRFYSILVMKRLYFEAEVLVNEGVPGCIFHFCRISQNVTPKLLLRFYSIQ